MKLVDSLNKNFKPVSSVKTKITKSIEKDLNRYVKNRYEEITDPFETDFTFELVTREEGDKFIFNVRPVLEEIPRSSNPERGTVSSWVLFNVLDQGNEQPMARVALPDDFDNESSPHSTRTGHVEYDRNDIFVDTEHKDQNMEPRDWSLLISEEYQAKRLVKTRAVVKDIVSGIFGNK